MNLKYLTLMFFILNITPVKFASAAAVSELSFSDKNWQKCIEKIAAKQGLSDTLAFTEIKCHNAGIEVVEGLAQFTNLTHLSLYKNAIETLDVQMLGSLTTLNVAANKLKHMQLSNLTQLQKLYAFNNTLTKLNVTGLRNLTHLRLMNNQLIEFDITPLVALQEGHLFNNQLVTIDLTPLSQLEFIDVRQNPMPDELYDEFDEMEGISISHDGNADDWK